MKTSNYNSNFNSGFSLVETLIYLAILSIIMTAIVPTFYALEQTRGRIGRSSVELSDRIFIESNIRQLIKNQRDILEPGLDEDSDTFEVRLFGGSGGGSSGDLIKIPAGWIIEKVCQ
ncbi:MAG: type II secretion system protein, partial [Patescibacteria group bacterium]